MPRYATDIEDAHEGEGDTDESWWITALWMHNVLSTDTPLSDFSPDPNTASISKQDQRNIVQCVAHFLRSVQARNDAEVYSTLTQAFQDALRELEKSFSEGVARNDPRYAHAYRTLFVWAYDITEYGITVTLQCKTLEDEWEQLLFAVFQERDGAWKISHLPDLDYTEDSEDETGASESNPNEDEVDQE